MRHYEDGQGFGMIPDKFDPSREVPETADRDSEGPARLAGLFREMDGYLKEWQRHCRSSDSDLLRSVGADLADTWEQIRQEMGK